MTARLTNIINGASVIVTSTTDHPDSHYGLAVWVDKDGIAYCQVDGPKPPFYKIDILDK